MAVKKIDYNQKNSSSGGLRGVVIAQHKMTYKTPKGEATLASDMTEEVMETGEKFAVLAKQETDKMLDNTSEDYYSVLVFNNDEQRLAFMNAVGVKATKSTNLRFINGVRLAEVMGIKLPASTSNEGGKFKVNRELLSFCVNPKKK